MQKLTIKAIRAKYPQEKKLFERNNLWGYFVLRQISYYPTWLFLKIGLSANQVTALSLLCGVIGGALMAFGGYWGIIAGALLFNAWALLDYVDGNIARYNNTASYLGSFLESLAWAIVGALLFISVGAAAYRNPDTFLNSIAQWLLAVDIEGSLFILLGGWASTFYILHEYIYGVFARISSEHQRDILSDFKKATISSLPYKIEANLNNISGMLMPILVLAAVLKLLGTFIFIWAIITTLSFLAVVTLILRRIKSGPIST